jgi:hypothetical protein
MNADDTLIPLDAGAPHEYCSICRAKHHPKWHSPVWREDTRQAAARALAQGRFGEYYALRDALQMTERKGSE